MTAHIQMVTDEALAAKRDMDEMRKRREEEEKRMAEERRLQEERIAEMRAQGEKQALEALEKQKADMAAMMAKMNEEMEREKAARAVEAKKRMEELEAKAKVTVEEKQDVAAMPTPVVLGFGNDDEDF